MNGPSNFYKVEEFLAVEITACESRSSDRRILVDCIACWTYWRRRFSWFWNGLLQQRTRSVQLANRCVVVARPQASSYRSYGTSPKPHATRQYLRHRKTVATGPAAESVRARTALQTRNTGTSERERKSPRPVVEIFVCSRSCFVHTVSRRLHVAAAHSRRWQTGVNPTQTPLPRKIGRPRGTYFARPACNPPQNTAAFTRFRGRQSKQKRSTT